MAHKLATSIYDIQYVVYRGPPIEQSEYKCKEKEIEAAVDSCQRCLDNYSDLVCTSVKLLCE